MIQVDQNFLRIGLLIWLAYVVIPVILRVVTEFLPFPLRLIVGQYF